MIKKLKYISIFLILLGFIFIHFYLPRIITEIKNPIITAIKGNYYQLKTNQYLLDSSNGKHIEFNSFDHVKLKAFQTYSKQDSTKGVIILLHGIRSHKEHFIDMSNYISNLGYDVISLDSRAHGESEGTHCTFGVKEKQDLKYLIDYLQKKQPFKTIGVWGQSLGGAIGLEALAYDSRINFGIIESTFSELNTITNDYLSSRTKIDSPLLSEYLLNRAGKIADFNPELAKPIEACKKINQPVLMVHGTADSRIKIEYSKNNFKYLSNPNCQYIEVENATHLNVWKVGGENYFNQVLRFIHKNSG